MNPLTTALALYYIIVLSLYKKLQLDKKYDLTNRMALLFKTKNSSSSFTLDRAVMVDDYAFNWQMQPSRRVSS